MANQFGSERPASDRAAELWDELRIVLVPVWATVPPEPAPGTDTYASFRRARPSLHLLRINVVCGPEAVPGKAPE